MEKKNNGNLKDLYNGEEGREKGEESKWVEGGLGRGYKGPVSHAASSTLLLKKCLDSLSYGGRDMKEKMRRLKKRM